MRSTWNRALTVCLLATAAAWGASEEPRRAVKTALPCGGITAVGCCEGDRLWWCKGGKLRGLDCLSHPSCGWRETGRYDCNTSGAGDPSGKHPLNCRFPGNRPRPSPAFSACGGVTATGCCRDNVLEYCEGRRLRKVDCGRNPACGWRSISGHYNCGTQGAAEPSGRHPRACPPRP